MRQSASESELLGVKSRILAEGLTPYEHATNGSTTLAVVGRRQTSMPSVDFGSSVAYGPAHEMTTYFGYRSPA